MTPYAPILASIVGLGLFVAWIGVRRAIAASKVLPTPLGRLDEYLTRARQNAEGEPEQDVHPQRSFADTLNALLEAQGSASQTRRRLGQMVPSLDNLLESANINMRASEWIVLSFLFGIAIALLVGWRLNPVVGIVMGVVIPYPLGSWFLTRRARGRIVRMNAQLGPALVQLANGLRAGHSTAQAIASVVHNGRAPLSVEFGRVLREIEMGVPTEEALSNMVDRNYSEDLDLAVTAVRINHRVGGNLAETFETIADTIRQRVRIEGEIKVLTGQARLSGWIISLLPVALTLILLLIAPDYVGRLFHREFGWIFVGVASFSLLIGIGIIRRIVDIDV